MNQFAILYSFGGVNGYGDKVRLYRQYRVTGIDKIDALRKFFSDYVYAIDGIHDRIVESIHLV